jgi:hypothetical protein
MDKESSKLLGEGLDRESCSSSRSISEEDKAEGESLYSRYAKEESYKDLIKDTEAWYKELENEHSV